MCTNIPPSNSVKDLEDYWIKVHEIFPRRTGIIGGVDAIIISAMLPIVVECQWRE